MTLFTPETTDISLPEADQQRLDALERVIEAGLETFYEVGTALLDIRDNRLYRAYSTFEDYCQQRWDMTRRNADRLIGAVGVVQNLRPLGLKLPDSERQARELIGLNPDDQRLVYEIVSETAPAGKVTAAHIKSVVTVLRDVLHTGAIDDGEGIDIPLQSATLEHLKAAVTETTYERMKRQEVYIDEHRKPKSNATGDHAEGEPDPRDACQTPDYAVDPLLPFLRKDWAIWEPAYGEGLLVEALYDGGMNTAITSDLLDQQDFLKGFTPAEDYDVIVTNPPYNSKYKFLARCYELGKPFALLMPIDVFGSKQAQDLFREHGVEVIFMNERIDFKMPIQAWRGNGAQFSTAWFCWQLGLGQDMTFADITEAKALFKRALKEAGEID